MYRNAFIPLFLLLLALDPSQQLDVSRFRPMTRISDMISKIIPGVKNEPNNSTLDAGQNKANVTDEKDGGGGLLDL